MHKIKVYEACVFELGKLPGIGRKTAVRLALHLLKMRETDVERLAASLVDLKKKTTFCKECGGISERELCEICADSARDHSTLCVVEEAKDVFIIEQTGQFGGVYHVLGGKISPLNGIGPDELRISELLERIGRLDVTEVILATNPDVEGETTALYITRQLKNLPGQPKVTKLASGIPIGSHLEYADDLTILKALEGRREL